MKSTGGPFSNAVTNLRQLRNSPASWAVLCFILTIHAVVALVGGPRSQAAGAVFEVLGLSKPGFFGGKFWTILTYGFLHGAWWHLAVNSLFVLLIGSRVEHMAGRAVMLKAMFFGVIGGGIGHLLLAPAGDGTSLLVGLSGGCVGLLLLLTTLSPQSKFMPLPISGRSLGLGILVTELFLSIVHPELGVPGFSQIGKWLGQRGMSGWYEIGHACHFGGGVAGWLYGRWLLRPRVTLKRLRAERLRREAVELKRGS